MIGKQVLAFGKSEKSEFINIENFAASSGGRKGRCHIGRFTPDRDRSHVCFLMTKMKSTFNFEGKQLYLSVDVSFRFFLYNLKEKICKL